MSNIRIFQALLLPAILFSLFIADEIPAKTRRIAALETKPLAGITTTDVASLEQRLLPFFENRALRRHNYKIPAAKAPPPRESDLMLLPKTWRLLSPRFKQIYNSAASLPDSSGRFDSPGGNFEIYYFTSGINGVAAGDLYGFSASDWRIRIDQPNGVPDYIDETAFALDSCWSMEIDRFGLAPPHSFIDSNHTSDRYKVVVEEQDVGYYGLTYLQDKTKGTHGYPSTISLRNDWSGPEWSDLGYDQKPLNGVRVTCAHEFFHAIQYGMSWDVVLDVWLDDFPLSWTEGAAVSMEELAFDSINDYLQYASSYFSNPEMSFFSPTTSDLVYTNAILLLYFGKFFPPRNGFEFIKTMTFTNYAARTPFHENLLNTSFKSGKTWTEVLHDFHIASFFTGNKADTTRFIADASRFRMRNIPELPKTSSITRNVALNGAKQIRLTATEFPQDTLRFTFAGDPSRNGNITGTEWACSMLLRKQDVDSFISIPIDAECNGVAVIPTWRTFDEAIIVITNGNPINSREVSLSFSNDTIPDSPELVVFPNPISVNRHRGTVRFRADNISAVSVRSVSGALIWSKVNTDLTVKEITWNCKNRSEQPVVPGTYQVLITRDNGPTRSIAHHRQKLLVIP